MTECCAIVPKRD